jgi:hypothetical protein
MRRYRDWNGPGKGITEAQIEEILAGKGIFPRRHPQTGEKFWHREDFEAAWKAYGIASPPRQQDAVRVAMKEFFEVLFREAAGGTPFKRRRRRESRG